MYGWMGKIVDVDLSRNKAVIKDLDEKLAVKFLGGRGLNSKVLYDNIKPGIDPLSPENIIAVAPGVFSGTVLPMSSRVEVSTLSPYSGILGDGNAGGAFAHRMKLSGFDQIIIRGRADKPVYILLEDGEVSLHPAEDLWGGSTWETTDALRERHGKNISVMSIGQAGENLVRVASVIVDKHASAARGSGAVFGSKNLKAIVVSGNKKVEIKDEDRFGELADEDKEFFMKDKFQREIIAVYGTHLGVERWYPGYLNFLKYLGPDEAPAHLKKEAWKKYEIGRYACYGCPVGCKNIFRIPEGRRKGETGTALEYEAIAYLGINTGIQDPIAIMEMENLADGYGMDAIALGNTIGYIKDLYNRGIITKDMTDGLDLSWENADDQVELIHRVALRQGSFANLVAEGLYNVARKLGGRAMDYCYHVKGLSRGPHPPGLFALAHATGTRGADHLRGRSWAYGENDPEVFPKLIEEGYLPKEMLTDPVIALHISERATTLADSIGRCKGAVNNWVSAVPLVWKYPLWKGFLMLFEAATGISMSERELELTLDRIYTLERCFNIRQGIKRKHDWLPQKPEIRDSPEGEKERKKHQEMLTRYYRAHGYDPETGVPTRERLKELDLVEEGHVLYEGMPYPDWNGPPLRDSYPQGSRRF